MIDLKILGRIEIVGAILLRGDDEQAGCGKVILPMTVLRRLYCVLVCLFGLAPAAAEAQDRSITQYAIEIWDRRSGLPVNSIESIAQSTVGYLWVGTQEGLTRFDGVEFRTFSRGSSAAFTTSDVIVVVAARAGGVWVGTRGGGLLYHANGATTAITGGDKGGPAAISALYEDEQGALWIGTPSGLSRLSDGRLVNYTAEHGFPESEFVVLAPGRSGAIWAGTETGDIFRIQNGRAERITSAGELEDEGIRALFETADGVLWIGTTTGLFHRRRGVLSRYSADPRLADVYVSAIHRDRRGALWVATRGRGLFRLGSSGGWEVRNAASGLPGDDVSNLTEDADGNIWIGTTGAGIAVLRAGPFLPVSPAQGLSGEIALPILQDRSGTMWIGTYGQGLNRLTEEDTTVLTTADGLADDFVLSLAEGRDGSLWVGTRSGLSRRHQGRFTTYDTRDGLPSSVVLALYIDPAGTLWAGTASGIARFEGNRFSAFTTEQGLSGGSATTLLQSRDGALWIGTAAGLTRLQDGRATVYTQAEGLPSSTVLALHEDSAGALWIGTNAGLVHMRGGRLRTIGAREGLYQDQVYCILLDDHGYYWFGGSRGVWRVAADALNDVAEGRADAVNSLAYDEGDGLPDAETNGGIQPACLKDREGRLWFSTMGGAAVVDPSRLQERASPVRVVVERVVADGEELRRDGQHVHIPAGTDHVEIDYTAINFRAPAATRFQYRLEGFDKEWFDADGGRTATYTGLRPGTYTLHVRARARDTDWSEATQVPLRLAPLFYQTRGFQLLLLLLLIGLLVAADQVRVRRHRSRVRRHLARERQLLDLIDQRTEAEERYTNLFENARDIVLTADEEGRILSVNRKGEEVLGAAKHELVGRPLEELVSPENRELVRAWTTDEETGGGAQELVLINSAGRRVPVEVTVQRIREDGTASGIQAIVRDVSERAALEERLRHSQKMEAVGRLAGGVAHDFNNLLTAIHGHTQLLLDDTDAGDPVRDDLCEIQSSVERATALTRQLLSFSRKQLIQPRVLDLNQVVRDLHQLLTRLIREDITLDLELDPALGAVRADPTTIEQVLVNLVVNARDAMPEGGCVVIRTAAVDIDAADVQWGDAPASGRFVRLSVGDTGVGMDDETRAQIFDPFFTTKPIGEGTGLGLSTVHGIVIQNGGFLRVDSEPGRGTTFHVYLPEVGAAPDPPAAAPADSGPGDARAAEHTLLLVEDDPSVRRLALKVLERAGYTVLQAAEGLEAIEIATRHTGHIHLLVTDLIMPNMSGQELVARLGPTRPGMKVVYMSGYAAEDVVDREELLSPRVSFIEKPFTPSALLEIVRTTLGQPAGGGEASA